MTELILWKLDAPLGYSYLISEDDKDLFDIWLEDNLNPEVPIAVFVSSKYSDALDIIGHYIALKHGVSSAIPFSDTYNKFIIEVSDCMSEKSPTHSPTVNPPNILFKANDFLGRVKSCFMLRGQLLQSLAWSNMRGVDFTHTWWELQPTVQVAFTDLIRDLRRAKASSPPCKNLLDWCKNLEHGITELSTSDFSKKLIIASALSFSAAKNSVGEGELDKALVLLHRSLDLYLQSLAVKQGIVQKGPDGLCYINGKKGDVTLDRTKTKLQADKNLKIPEHIIKKIDRINFLRNRSFLAHSLCSISTSNIEDQVDSTYTIVQFLESGSGVWRRAVKRFLGKPPVSEFDVFHNEDSFDAYFRIIEDYQAS